jgi:HEPN domain-containing protein
MSDEVDLARTLLGLARDDEFAARSLLPVAGVADSILGFHAQQAVEKSLKAALARHGIDYPYSHDLDGFVELCKNNALDLPEELDGVDRLSEFGVRVRYGMTEVALDRDQALRWAARAVEWAEGIVDAAQESVDSPGEAAKSVDE